MMKNEDSSEGIKTSRFFRRRESGFHMDALYILHGKNSGGMVASCNT